MAENTPSQSDQHANEAVHDDETMNDVPEPAAQRISQKVLVEFHPPKPQNTRGNRPRNQPVQFDLGPAMAAFTTELFDRNPELSIIRREEYTDEDGDDNDINGTNEFPDEANHADLQNWFDVPEPRGRKVEVYFTIESTKVFRKIKNSIFSYLQNNNIFFKPQGIAQQHLMRKLGWIAYKHPVITHRQTFTSETRHRISEFLALEKNWKALKDFLPPGTISIEHPADFVIPKFEFTPQRVRHRHYNAETKETVTAETYILEISCRKEDYVTLDFILSSMEKNDKYWTGIYLRVASRRSDSLGLYNSLNDHEKFLEQVKAVPYAGLAEDVLNAPRVNAELEDDRQRQVFQSLVTAGDRIAAETTTDDDDNAKDEIKVIYSIEATDQTNSRGRWFILYDPDYIDIFDDIVDN